ncbi:MAG: serine/threonine protein kinase [Deltaproteobacteria bacterium]|nr:serine/threonine protein kinase [Deltaproteobacteria bacterium]
MDDEFPSSIAGYTLERRLSTGGMGAVFLASRSGAHGFEKQFAIKILLPHLFGRGDATELFADEARLVARLSHPNICQVFDFGEDAGFCYLVMEYIDGFDLNALLRAQRALGAPLPQELAARIVADAARGLQHAHESRSRDGKPLEVVHRDVSPDNIVVTHDGCAKVLDFGIARWADRIAVTQGNAVRGKAAYMSPEQVMGKPLDRRSDLFSLATVFFELVTNRPLFKRLSIVETMRAVVEDPIPLLSAAQPDAHPSFVRIVQRALARDPAQRFSSAEQLTGELELAIAEVGRPATSEVLADHLRSVTRPACELPVPAAAGPFGQTRGAGPAAVPTLTTHGPLQPKPTTAPAPTAASQVRQSSSRGTQLSIAALALVSVLAAGIAAIVWLGQRVPAPDRGAVGADLGLAAIPTTDRADGGAAVLAIETADAAATAAVTETARLIVEVEEALAAELPDETKGQTAPDSAGEELRRERPAVGGAGAISVFATPWGMVRLDGKLLGPTPLLRHTLGAGSHVVELVAPDTAKVVERRSVKVAPGKELRVRFRSE